MAKNTLVEALTVESLLPFSFLFSARSTFEAVHSGSFDEFYYFFKLENMSNHEIRENYHVAVRSQAESKVRATDGQNLQNLHRQPTKTQK